MDLISLGVAIQNSKKNDKNGYNIASLTKFHDAVADVGRNPIKVALVGDSITWGAHCSDVMATNWASRLRTALQAKFGNVGYGTYPIPYSTFLTATPWVMAGSWTYSNGNGVVGRYMTGATSATATLTFTGTSCDVIFAKNTSGGTATVTIDGVTKTAINCNDVALSFGNVVTYSDLSTDSHTIVITAPASGYAFIESLTAYNPIAAGDKGCYVFNVATPGALTDWHLPFISKVNSLYSPHLVIIGLGINDARALSSTYYANMGTLIQGYQNAGASVLLLNYGMIDDTTDIEAIYQSYAPQLYNLADIYNCAFVDIYTRWGKSWTTAYNAGKMSDGAMDGNAGNNQLHPSDKGHRDIASAIAMNLIGTTA